MRTTLTVNPGSSSKKYALYRNSVMVREFFFENTNVGFEACTIKRGDQQTCESITTEQYENALLRVAKECDEFCAKEGGNIDSVAVRVVDPVRFFNNTPLSTRLTLLYFEIKSNRRRFISRQF